MCDSDKFSTSGCSEPRISRFFHLPLVCPCTFGRTASDKNFQHPIYHTGAETLSNRSVWSPAMAMSRPYRRQKPHIQTQYRIKYTYEIILPADTRCRRCPCRLQQRRLNPRSQSEPRGYRTRHRTDRVHARCPGQPLCNPHLLRFGRLDAHRHRRRRGLADRHARKRHGRQPDRRTGGPKEFQRGGTHSPSRNLLRQATRAGNRHPAHDRHLGFHRPVRPVVRPRIAGDGPYLRCGKDLATRYGISGQCDQVGRFERVYRTLDLPARDRVFRVAAKSGLLRYGPDRAGYPQ